MKKISILLIALLISCQYKTSNTEIKAKSAILEDVQKPAEFVGIHLNTVQGKETELNLKFEFLTIESNRLDINNDGKEDEIIIEKIKDWNDPGDYHRIRIKSKEKEYVFFNSDGWVEIGAYETQYLNSFPQTTQVKSKYVNIQRSSDKDILLFAFGYVYASQPGLLSILNLSRFDKPELIFNDNYHLYSFEDKNSDGIVDIVVTKNDIDEMDNNDNLKTYLLENGSYQPK